MRKKKNDQISQEEKIVPKWVEIRYYPIYFPYMTLLSSNPHYYKTVR